MSAYQLLLLFIVTHEKGRHNLTCPPSVDVSCGHRGPGPEVLDYVLEAEVMLDVLLPLSPSHHAVVSPFTGQINDTGCVVGSLLGWVC